jgi:hypothetical protein
VALSSTAQFVSLTSTSLAYRFIKCRRTAIGAGPLPATVTLVYARA